MTEVWAIAKELAEAVKSRLFFSGHNELRRPQQRPFDFAVRKTANGIPRQRSILLGAGMSGVERTIAVQDFQNLGVSHPIERAVADYGLDCPPLLSIAALERMYHRQGNLALAQIAGHRLPQNVF